MAVCKDQKDTGINKMKVEATYFIHTHAGSKISQLEVAMSVQKHVVWFHISVTSKPHSKNFHLLSGLVPHPKFGLKQSTVKIKKSVYVNHIKNI